MTGTLAAAKDWLVDRGYALGWALVALVFLAADATRPPTVTLSARVAENESPSRRRSGRFVPSVSTPAASRNSASIGCSASP